MFVKNLPRGWLPVSEAIKRVVWRQHGLGAGPKERDKAEEAWRKLCERASEGRIRAIIFTEDGKAVEADLGQFIALQERYLFHAGTQGHWLENEQRHVELEVEPNRKFVDKHGRSVCGELLFSESDLETVFNSGEHAEKTAASEDPRSVRPFAGEAPRKTREQVLKELIASDVRPGRHKDWSWKRVCDHVLKEVGDPAPRGCSPRNIRRLYSKLIKGGS